MTIHNLTTEQLQKFVYAVGGVRKPEFTTEQLQKLSESIKGLSDWPKATDDPRVNYAVDCVVWADIGHDEYPYDEKLYTTEVELMAKRKFV